MSGVLGHKAGEAASSPADLDRFLVASLAALRLGVGLPILALALAIAFGWLAPPQYFGGWGGSGWVEIAAVAAALVYGGLIGGLVARAALLRAQSARAGAAAYAELVENLGDVALRLDRSGCVVAVASDPQSLLGVGRGELIGRGLFERLLVVDRPAFLKAVAEAAAGEPVTLEVRLRRGPEDAAPHFAWTELRLRRSTRAPGEALALLRDATPMREALSDMTRARGEAERANELKNRFVANISHELRTPLNAIIGFSDLLSQEETAPRDPVQARDYAGLIHESGRHLLDLVNMILDLSRIEAGGFELAPENFELAGLADLCCEMVRLKAQAKKIALTRSYVEELGDICADRRAVMQILLNLLANAVKFTPEDGEVALSCRFDGAMVEIAVTDTGVGVAEADLSRLGAPFFQAESGYDRRHEGAGLGLSVVRGLVGLHGGRLSFESAPGEGSRVAVLLPRDFSASKAPRGAAPIEFLARRLGAAPQKSFARAREQVKKIA